MIIYKIVNNINNKIYIGLTTKDLSRRIAEHIRENKSYIQKALNKYGLESFTISVIDHAESKEILKEKEKYWIKFYNCKSPNGYNLTDGGDGLINPTQEVRDKISNTLMGHDATSGFTGHNHSKESLEKMSESLKVTMNKPEVKEKLSKANKDKPMKEATKKKISKSKKGKKRTDIVWNKNKKMKDINPNYINPMQGKKRPDLAELNKSRIGTKQSKETCDKRSKSLTGKPKSKEHLKNIAIAKAKKKKNKQNQKENK